MQYLLRKGVGWSSVSVALAVDSGLCTSTNGIHLPVSVVVVHHMEISMSTPALFMSYEHHITNWYCISATIKAKSHFNIEYVVSMVTVSCSQVLCQEIILIEMDR